MFQGQEIKRRNPKGPSIFDRVNIIIFFENFLVLFFIIDIFVININLYYN